MSRDWVEVIVYALAIVLFLLFAKGCQYYECDKTARMMGTDYRYELIGGCYIKENDRYIPSKMYRVMD